MTTGICKFVRKVSDSGAAVVQRFSSASSRRSLSSGSFGRIGSSSGSRNNSFRRNANVRKKASALIEEQKWDDLRDLLASIPPAQVHESARKNERRQTLLHALCANVPPLDLVETLAAIIPGALEDVDHLGRTVLHVAVLEDADLDVVRYLLRSNPSLAECRDSEGKTPLFLACEKYGLAAAARGDQVEDMESAGRELAQIARIEGEAKMERLDSVTELLATEGSRQRVAIEDVFKSFRDVRGPLFCAAAPCALASLSPGRKTSPCGDFCYAPGR